MTASDHRPIMLDDLLRVFDHWRGRGHTDAMLRMLPSRAYVIAANSAHALELRARLANLGKGTVVVVNLEGCADRLRACEKWPIVVDHFALQAGLDQIRAQRDKMREEAATLQAEATSLRAKLAALEAKGTPDGSPKT